MRRERMTPLAWLHRYTRLMAVLCLAALTVWVLLEFFRNL